MDFMTDVELDGYLVLIFFMLKKKNSLTSKKPLKVFAKGNIQRESSGRTYNSLVHELQIGDREFHFK